MNRRRYSLPVLVVAGISGLAAGAALVYWRAGQPGPQAASPPERPVLYWHDPMVPNARFDKPGKSPFMDMQLVPVHADEANADTGVRVSPNVVQNLGVRIGKVEQMTVSPRLTAAGTVAFNEQLLQVVSSRAEGVVLQLQVRTLLEPVRKGQTLARVQIPAWIEAQQQYLALLDAESESGRALRAAARERLRILGVPESTVRHIDATRQVDGTTQIVAPADGVVTELGVREGSVFPPGAPLFRINGLGTVWVNARIPEVQMSGVRAGAAIEARSPARPGEIFRGQVATLLPQVDAETRTFTARAVLDNTGGRLSPGMFVSLDVTDRNSSAQLVVPDEAVIRTGKRTVVITSGEDGSFAVADVRIGAEQDGRTVVLSGLTAGQSIVLSGQFLIDSEASLTSSLERLEGGPGAPGTGSIDDAPVAHLAEGTLVATDGKSVTLDHGAVPSLHWPAMTMAFEAPAQGLPPDLKPGDHVTFSFVATAGGYRLVQVLRSGVPAGPDGSSR